MKATLPATVAYWGSDICVVCVVSKRKRALVSVVAARSSPINVLENYL